MKAPILLDRRASIARVCLAHSRRIVASDNPWEQALLQDCSGLFDRDVRLQLVRLTTDQGAAPRALSVESWFDEPSGDAASHDAVRFDALLHPTVRILVRGRASVVRLSDHEDLERFRATEVFHAVHPEGARYLGACTLMRDGAGITFLGVERTRRDLDGGDRDTLGELSRVVGAAVALRQTLEAMGSVPSPAGSAAEPYSIKATASYRPTPRQEEVLGLVVDGLTSAQIGRRLGITERAVRKHLERIYADAGLPSRSAAAAWWQRQQVDHS